MHGSLAYGGLDSQTDGIRRALALGDRQAAVARGADDGTRYWMGEPLLGRGSEGENLLGACRAVRDDVDDFRSPEREGSGLVEHDGIDVGQTLQRSTTFDQDPRRAAFVIDASTVVGAAMRIPVP